MHKNLNIDVDVLIVGGGIIGMLTARSLEKKGLKIAIFEKGVLGGEATWAAGGILSSLIPWHDSPKIKPLIDEGKQNFARLVEELKQETSIDPEMIQSGMLFLDVEDEKNTFDWANNNNVSIETFTSDTLLKHEPNISSNFENALCIPNIAQIRPPKLISALKKYLQNQQVAIYENCTTDNIIVNANTVTGISTESGSIHAEKVILCSGSWTNSLLPKETDFRLDIEPVRGQMILYRLSEKALSHIIMKDQSYLIPRQDGHILCGSTLEYVGFDNGTTQEALQSLQAKANDLMPLLAKHQPIKQWSGLRPGTRQDSPYICKHPTISGLYINSGHHRNGIIMSLASARIMTELITNSQNPSQTAAIV